VDKIAVRQDAAHVVADPFCLLPPRRRRDRPGGPSVDGVRAGREIWGPEYWQAIQVCEAVEARRREARGFQACTVERRSFEAPSDLPAEPVVAQDLASFDRQRLELLVPIRTAHVGASGTSAPWIA
jgi:hypothetical protein